jgi:hypothetical protein
MASSFASLTPLAWRLADAEQAVEISTASWQRATSPSSKALWAQIVNDDLDALDELRGEAGL